MDREILEIGVDKNKRIDGTGGNMISFDLEEAVKLILILYF